MATIVCKTDTEVIVVWKEVRWYTVSHLGHQNGEALINYKSVSTFRLPSQNLLSLVKIQRIRLFTVI